MNKSVKTPVVILACAMLWCGLGSCKQTAKELFSVNSPHMLDSIPSGSGMVVDDGMAYIVGDDATHIYRLELASLKTMVIAIAGLDSLIYREAKPVKHDLECATLLQTEGRKYLLAMGSGSKAAVRDSAILLNLSDYKDCRLFSMGLLYDHIRKEANIPAERWNVEGLTIAGKQLLLANRGTDNIIGIDLGKFVNWLQDPGTDLFPVEIHTLMLPAIDNKQARLSGLCTKNETEIFFCASVEDTPDWVTDGPILGSFVGSYSLKDRVVTATYLLRTNAGKPMREKVESLDIVDTNNNGTMTLMAIADNDDGSSKIFNLNIPQD